jgi:hypothetical protein
MASDWDPIRGSHHGQRPKWLQQQAEYMTAPDICEIALASRAPSKPQSIYLDGRNLGYCRQGFETAEAGLEQQQL